MSVEADGDVEAKPVPRSRGLRAAGWILVGMAILGLLVTCVLAWFVATESGRDSLIGVISSRLLEQTGWQLEMDDMAIGLGAGRVSAEGVRLGAPGARPFIRLEGVVALVDMAKLWQREILFESIEIEAPTLDLGAPIPPPVGGPGAVDGNGEAEAAPVSIPDILSWRLVDAAIVNGQGRGWLAAFEGQGLNAQGSLVDGAMEAELVSGRLRLERSADGYWLPIDLGARIRGPLGGPLTLDHLRAEGEALDAQVSGTLGLAESQPFSAAFTGSVDPALLVPEIAAGAGVASLDGGFNLESERFWLKVSAPDFPLAVLEPFVPPEIFASAGEIDRLDLEADLRLQGADMAETEGRVAALLRAGDKAVLEVEGATVEGAENALLLDTTFALLPDEEKRIQASGKLAVEAWSRFGEARIEGARVEIEDQDLRVLAERLRGIWPEQGALSALPAANLGLEASIHGTLDDPLFDIQALARPRRTLPSTTGDTTRIPEDDGAEIRLGLSGSLQAMEARVDLVSFDPADFDLPVEMPVSAPWSGWLELGSGGARADLKGELRAPHLSAETMGLSLSELEIVADLNLPWWRDRPDADFLSGGTVGGRLEARGLGVSALGGSDAESSSHSADFSTGSLGVELTLDEVPGAWLMAPTATTLDNMGREALTLTLDAERVRLGDSELPSLELEVTQGSAGWQIRQVSGLLSPPEAVGVDQLPFRGEGSFRFGDGALPGLESLEYAKFDLEAGDASRDMATFFRVRFEEEHLSFQVPRFEIDDALASGSLRAEIPLAQVLKFAARENLGASSSGGAAAEPVVLVFDLAGLEAQGFARWMGPESGATLPEMTGAVRGVLRFDLEDPVGAVGQVVVASARWMSPEGAIETARPVAIRVGDRRAELLPSELIFGEHDVKAAGHVRFAPGWRPGDAAVDLVESFDFEAGGAVSLGILEGRLPGAYPEGVLAFSLSAEGTPANPNASIYVNDAGGAAFIWDRPYLARFSSPSAHIEVVDGAITIEEANALLNEGDFAVRGALSPAVDLSGELEDVRLRLDYGLTVDVGGTFRYAELPEPGKIEADIVVDRGTLRRRIDAGQQVLDLLLAPPALESVGEVSDFDQTELSIRLATNDGVKVKNNLADLRVGWAPLSIEGTLAEPRIQGTLEADPDGRVYAYGQVLRLDRAALVFSGAPAAAPTLDLQVTTSLEDPSLLTPQDQRVLASLAQGGGDFQSLDGTERSARVRENVATGLTTYLGDRLASRLGQALGRTQLRYRPLWIFGEADPEARLVVSRDVSRYASIGVAFDLREADEQTYLLEVGRFPRLPRLTGTLFSDDQAQLGATFQQQLTFGGKTTRELETGFRLRSIQVRCGVCAEDDEAPEQARRAVAWRRGQRVDPDAVLDLEVEVAEYLRGEGFPDPQVSVELSPGPSDQVDLEIDLEPGPKAEFVWLGEEPPRARRRTLQDLYRSDYSETASLLEIEETAERIWRSRGHPWPRIHVRVEASEDPPIRQVMVESDPGESLELGAPVFEGVPGEVARELENRFLSRQSRAELIVGINAADIRVHQAMNALGYPRARVLERSYDAEEARSRIYLEAGPRRHVASLALVGSPSGEEERLGALITVEQGAPLIGSELAAIAFALEKDLRERGWVSSRVRLEVSKAEGDEQEISAASPGPLMDAHVRFEIEPGVRQRLGDIVVDGAAVTRKDWVERLAGVEKKRGELVNATQVAEARRRLLETRLFDRVQVDVETTAEGEAVLRFDLAERPRYLAAYGLRWEESEGFGALVDILDRNAGGRGVGLGLRALWVQSEKSLRLYSNLPRLFNSDLSLELFVEGFEEDDEGLVSKGFELSAQLKWPLGPQTELRSYVRYRRAEVRDDLLGLLDDSEETPLLGLQIVHDGRDDPLDPRRGFFASADLSGSEDFVAADESYIRLFAQVDHYSPLAPRWTWAQGVRLGGADVISGELPRDVRFFAGGARSLRGYARRSVGPQETGGERALGGEALMILHEELRFDLHPDIQGVLFYDVGNVWKRAEEFGEDWLHGVGLGVRYRSPIGLLRLDVAHALDRRENDEEVEVYIGLGHAF